MATASVGKLSITVYPDTKRFRPDLRKTLDRIEKQVKAEIEVIPVVTRQAAADVRRDLKQLLKDVTVQVDLEASRQALRRIKDQINDVNGAATVDLDTDALNRSLRHAKDQIDDVKGTATVNVDLDKGKAQAALAVFDRPRTITLNVAVGKASLAAALATIKALAGGNVIGRIGSGLKGLVTNMDTVSLKVASMGAVLLNVGALAMTAVGGLTTFGRGLTAMAPAALALPGILGGVAIGFGVLSAAMVDAKDVLADLGPAMTALQDRLSGSFWDQAAQPIRDLATQALPMLAPGLDAIAMNLGRMTRAIAAATAEHLPGFQATLGATAKAIDVAGEGVGAFTSGILSLGEVGAQYLPGIASAFTNIAYSFEAWATKAAASGEIKAAIDGAWKAVKQFGDLLVQVGGILGAIFSAVGESGATSLSPMIEALRQVNRALSTAEAHDGLAAVFTAARKAVDELGPGLAAIMGALGDLGPVLSQILPVVGQIGSVALTGIADAVSSLAASGGLQDMFDGLLVAVQALAPVMPTLGTALGQIATVAGQLLAVLGPLIAQLVTALAPIIAQLATVLGPLIAQLGAALMPVIAALAPVLTELVAALLPPLLQIIMALLPVIVQLANASGQILVPAIQMLAPVFELVAQAIVALMPVISALIETGVAQFQYMAPIIQAVMNGIVSFISTALDIIRGVVNIVLGIINGDWSRVWGGIQQVASAIWNAIRSTISSAISVVSAVISAVLNSIRALWGSVWSWVSQTVGNSWRAVTSVVSAGVSNLMGLLGSLPGRVRGVFASAGSWLLSAGRAIIDGLISGIRGAFDRVRSTLSSLTSMLPDWKGPAPVDRVILKPAGRLVMGGFVDGLESQYDKAQRSLGGFTRSLSTDVSINAAPAGTYAGAPIQPSFQIVNHDPQVAAKYVAQEMRGLMGVL